MQNTSQLFVLRMGSLCDVMDKVLDSDLKVSEFKLQLCYYVPFGLIFLGKIWTPSFFAQSAGAVEYTDCFSAEG